MLDQTKGSIPGTSFREVVMAEPPGSNPGSSPTSKDSERRVRVRSPLILEILCKPGEAQSGESWGLAGVSDMSATGIGLILEVRMEPGTMVTIEVPGAEPGQPAMIPARVTNVTPLDNNQWRHGCVFVHKLNEDELKTLK